MSETAHEKYRRSIGRWRCATIILTLVCFGLIIAVAAVTLYKDNIIKKTTAKPCGGRNSVIDVSEAQVPTLFDDLTASEMKGIQEYIYSVQDLKLVKPEKAMVNSSYIYIYDYFPPKKVDVLKYLDSNGKKPERQGRLVIFRGDLNPAIVEEYLVGPLPNPTYHKLLVSNVRKNPVPYSHRPIGGVEYNAIFENVLVPLDKEIGYILKESYGATFTNCGDKCLIFYPAPLSTAILNKDVRKMWMDTMQNIEYYSLHPLDFSVLANIDSPDPSNFFIEKIVYSDKEYTSVKDLIKAYNTTAIKKTRVTFPEYNDNLFSTLNRRGNPVPDRQQRPPKIVEPDGKRYNISHRHVEYLQWSFDFRLSTLTGPQIYDVRFGGERIAYEISLQEIAVYYSGYSSAPRAPDFVDSGALIGTHAQALVPGADCPESATFISTKYVGEMSLEPIILDKSFCIFEQDTGIPLKRHLSYSVGEGGFYSGLSDIVLILRTTLTIVNYDYIADFVFHKNGALEVRTLSTGYIYTTFFTDKKGPYGFQLQDNIIGNIHHHLFHWKADLDVLGTKNRYETLDISTENLSNEPNSGIPGETYAQILFRRTLKETEQKAAFKFNFDTPKYHIFHNDKHQTKHGVPRAFRIHMTGMTKQMLPENNGNEMAISWARYQLAVTKHKEDEFGSSSCYAMFDNRHPTIYFDKFIEDNDNITDEDLVAWISTGVYHIPHTEDLPVSPTVGAHFGFVLLPYNYFDECPSMGSRDAIRVDLKNKQKPDEGVVVNRYGNQEGVGCVAKMADYDQELKENPDAVLHSKRKGSGFY